jgi:hypothetical protein
MSLVARDREACPTMRRIPSIEHTVSKLFVACCTGVAVQASKAQIQIRKECKKKAGTPLFPPIQRKPKPLQLLKV